MLVSIITPTYNRADLLPETIDSVLSQDYPHIDYLVLDDGSTDDTRAVLERYGSRIRTEYHPNMGETSTVNRGFTMVEGDIVCVVSSDDPLLPGAVQEAVNAFLSHPDAVAAYPDWASIDERSEIIRCERLDDYDITNMLSRLNWGIGPGAFFKRRMLNKVGLRNPRFTYCGDMEFWLRMAMHGPLIHIPKVLATHRVHSGSASVSQRGRKMASEWVQTFHLALRSPGLPENVARDKYRILREAYHIAAKHYIGSDRLSAAAYRVRAAVYWLYELRGRVADARWDSRAVLAALRTLIWRVIGLRARNKAFALGVALLRLVLRVRSRKNNTGGSISKRFAFSTRFLPPMWSGQAVVIGRLLAGLSSDAYCLVTRPVFARREENVFTDSLPTRYYDLPEERRIPSGSQSAVVRNLNLFLGILQRGMAIAKALRDDPVDTLIGCTGDPIDPPATFLAARILGCRYFLYFFDDYTEQWWADPPMQRLIGRIERVLAVRAEGLISPNEYMQQELKRRYQRSSFVVRNPCPLQQPSTDPAPFPSSEGEIKLVFTGAIYHLNYDIFRSIIAAIGKIEHCNVRLHLYTAQPQDQLVQQGLTGPHVTIHPHLHPAEAMEVQRNADILLIPFSFQPEAEGIVRTSATAKLADYLMMGRPVMAICHEDSFLGWYLNEYGCGIVVPSQDPSVIADAIQTVITDAGLRETLRKNATERARTDFDAKISQAHLLNALGFQPADSRAHPRLRPDAMKIVLVSGYDTLGIQVNGYLLYQYLQEQGHDAHMLVYRKFSADNNVHELGNEALRRMNRLAASVQHGLATHCVLPVLSCGMLNLPCVENADIVNLQLVHNAQFFSLLHLPRLSRKRRILLSIHDMFLFTGHCVYSVGCERWRTGCGSCPDLDLPFAVAYDATALNWRLKKWIFGRSDIDLVVGSPWQYERVKSSPILSHLPLHYVPYGVDTRIFKAQDKASARAELGIPADAHVIAFRSVSGRRNFKGGEYIETALMEYQPTRDTYLVTFEDSRALVELRGKYKFVEMGWVSDQQVISRALNAADIFLMPSIAEAFGLMAVESMACGTPAIVFEGTALPETIDAPRSGIAVPYQDSAALGRAIKDVFDNPDYLAELRENALRHVARKHSFEAYASGYLNLYRELVSGRPRNRG